ncbi:NERD domain-containing protein [Actinospica robiniae]|uniref:NERD domain-containing protein n=1 Tax=Actinospica robiniae TaxID=304901 RepID=UPI0003F60652|nr:NERD domain-containing protein [Actinospica robiniae]
MALLIERWQRHGQHRLYVKDTETRAQLGYYDCRTGKLSLKDETRSYEIVLALRPYLSGSVPAGLQHLMPEYPAPPEDLLARTEEYETFSDNFERPKPHGLSRISWPRGEKAERVVGRRLVRLSRDGWDLLRTVDPHEGAEAAYLVIGPPGVFTVSALRHPGARIRVGADAVWVDNTIKQYLRHARHEAALAARRLAAQLGQQPPVLPVLAFVDAADVDTHDGHPDVLVVRGERIDDELRDCRAAISLPERDRLVAAVHRSGAWTL